MLTSNQSFSLLNIVTILVLLLSSVYRSSFCIIVRVLHCIKITIDDCILRSKRRRVFFCRRSFAVSVRSVRFSRVPSWLPIIMRPWFYRYNGNKKWGRGWQMQHQQRGSESNFVPKMISVALGLPGGIRPPDHGHGWRLRNQSKKSVKGEGGNG